MIRSPNRTPPMRRNRWYLLILLVLCWSTIIRVYPRRKCSNGGVLAQQPANQRHRQANYAGIISLDTRNPARRHALDSIGSSLVQRLTRSNVFIDLVIAER